MDAEKAAIIAACEAFIHDVLMPRFAPGKLAERVLRDRYDQRMTRRALARSCNAIDQCSHRIKNDSTHLSHGSTSWDLDFLDSAYLRMVLRASWRYGRRGARILNRTIPFFTRIEVASSVS